MRLMRPLVAVVITGAIAGGAMAAAPAKPASPAPKASAKAAPPSMGDKKPAATAKATPAEKGKAGLHMASMRRKHRVKAHRARPHAAPAKTKTKS
jgi:hypothetical protein